MGSWLLGGRAHRGAVACGGAPLGRPRRWSRWVLATGVSPGRFGLDREPRVRGGTELAVHNGALCRMIPGAGSGRRWW